MIAKPQPRVTGVGDVALSLAHRRRIRALLEFYSTTRLGKLLRCEGNRLLDAQSGALILPRTKARLEAAIDALAQKHPELARAAS
jgi:hypothetical protein